MPRKRRGRNEGGIRQRPDGLWEATVSMGFDAVTGKRKRRAFHGRTKGEALQKREEWVRENAAGRATAPSRETLADYLARWLLIVQRKVEPETFRSYQRHVRLHVAPRVGHIRLTALERVHVEQLYAMLARDGQSATNAGKIVTTLVTALNAAVDLKLIQANPAARIKKPKPDRRKEIHPLRPDEIQRFLSAASSDRYYPLYVLALDSGMRPGELFALEWEDVDLVGGFVQVRRALEYHKGRLRVKDVKTRRARRRIDLAASTVEVLTAHRARLTAAGYAGPLVFPTKAGNHISLRDFHEYHFGPAMIRAGLTKQVKLTRGKQAGQVVTRPAFTPYDLRHTCATMLLLANPPIHPKVISERLGHSSTAFTMDTYASVLPTMQQAAARAMDAVLRPPAIGDRQANSGTGEGG